MSRIRVLGPALAASVVAFSGQATADGYYPVARPDGCCFSWTGFYLGANLGIGASDIRDKLAVTNGTPALFAPAVLPGINESGSQNLDTYSAIGGGQIGFNLQSGQIVWGLELDLDALRLKKGAGGPFNYSTGLGAYVLTEDASANWLLTVRPRVGLALGRGLAYVTGGLAVTSVDFHQFFAQTNPADPHTERAAVSKTKAGWTVGAGYEHAFAPNWTFKAEYLFTRFELDDAVAVLTVPNAGSATFDNHLDHLDIQTIRVGINYKFGDCCARPLK